MSEPDILATLSGLHTISARVGVNIDLRAIEVQIFGQGDWQLVMAPRSALLLANQLLGAIVRLEREPDEGVRQTPYDYGEG